MCYLKEHTFTTVHKKTNTMLHKRACTKIALFEKKKTLRKQKIS